MYANYFCNSLTVVAIKVEIAYIRYIALKPSDLLLVVSGTNNCCHAADNI